jgi:hypothetical protein
VSLMTIEMILARGEFIKIKENEYQQCFDTGIEVKCKVASLQEVVEAVMSSDYAIFVFRNPDLIYNSEAIMKRFLELINAVIDRASREGKRIKIVMKIPKEPISDPRDLLFKAFAYMEITP